MVLDDKKSAILLDGQNDHLVLDSSLPKKLEQFSVSSWVKPDYKTGAASTLSVVSEADVFDLSINNNKIDKNIAVFSVYDGMKWHTVESQTAIPENWTHISATFSNNSINISVNGVQENSKKIDCVKTFPIIDLYRVTFKLISTTKPIKTMWNRLSTATFKISN